MSTQPDKCSAMNNLPLGTVQRLWQSAESILQHYGIKELESGDFVVCEYDKASIIRKTSGGLICECMDFKSGLGICAYVLATSETRGQLPDLLERFSYNPSQAMHKQRKKGAGDKRLKKPRKGRNNVASAPVHTEINRGLPPVLQPVMQIYPIKDLYHSAKSSIITISSI